MYTKIFMKNTRMKQKKKWYPSATVHSKVLTSATKGRNEKKKTTSRYNLSTTSQNTVVQYNAMFRKEEVDGELPHHQRLR